MRGLRLPLTLGRWFVLLALLVLLALVGVPTARAQDVSLAPSEAVACLTPPPAERGEPDYPFMLYKAGSKGRVKATVLFRDDAWLPSIDIVESEGDRQFVDSVKTHLRALRVPCLPKGGQATLQFDYVFDPKDEGRVSWYQPEDLADRSRGKLLGCVTGGPKSPDYPRGALQSLVQGRVWARVRFVAPDRPPDAEVHHRPGHEAFGRAVRLWLEERRMPCHEGGPIAADLSFVFLLQGEAYGFKPMSLRDLFGHVQGIRNQRLQLDTTTMGCPFQLKLTYRQPDAPNRVGQVGSVDPARRPLIEWLQGIKLDLPTSTLDAVYADTADIEVPCLKIALTPQEKPT